MSAVAERQAPAGAEDSGRTPAVALGFAAIVLAMLPAVLDQTILATALPTIAADLGSVADVSWVVTAYVIAAAATTPLWGKLGDRRGRKRLLEVALTLFLAASALCGVTQDIAELIGARALQGAAAGGLMTLAMASRGRPGLAARAGPVPGSTSPPRSPTTTVVGPLIGGALVEGGSWRWVFYVNLPVGLIALAGLRGDAPRGPRQRSALAPARPARRRAAGGGHDRAHAHLRLGRGAVRVGVVADARPGGRDGRRRLALVA